MARKKASSKRDKTKKSVKKNNNHRTSVDDVATPPDYIISIYNYVTRSQDIMKSDGVASLLNILRDHHYIYADGVIDYLLSQEIAIPNNHMQLIPPFSAFAMEVVCLMSDNNYDNIAIDIAVKKLELFRDIVKTAAESLEMSAKLGYILGYSHKFVMNGCNGEESDEQLADIADFVADKQQECCVYISAFKHKSGKKIATNERKFTVIYCP